VGHFSHGDKTEGIACSNRSSARSSFVLEAAHITAGHASDAEVTLVVLRLSDRRPFCGFGRAVDDELREAICNPREYD
jgi:hypothetical protein